MNPRILEILPKKKRKLTKFEKNYPCGESGERKGFNQAIDEVTTALSKADVCLCPSEKELMEVILKSELYEDAWKYNSLNDDIENALIRRHVSKLAKAIRKLMMEGKI